MPKVKAKFCGARPCRFDKTPTGCQKPGCKFLHDHNRLNSEDIQCKFSSLPGGCNRQNCKYFHPGGGADKRPRVSKSHSPKNDDEVSEDKEKRIKLGNNEEQLMQEIIGRIQARTICENPLLESLPLNSHETHNTYRNDDLHSSSKGDQDIFRDRLVIEDEGFRRPVFGGFNQIEGDLQSNYGDGYWDQQGEEDDPTMEKEEEEAEDFMQPIVLEDRDEFLKLSQHEVIQTSENRPNRQHRNILKIVEGEIITFESHCDCQERCRFALVRNAVNMVGLVPLNCLSSRVIKLTCAFCPVTREFYTDEEHLQHLCNEHFKNRLKKFVKLTAPYKCPIKMCGREFSSLDSLLQHYGGLPHKKVVTLVFDAAGDSVRGMRKRTDEQMAGIKQDNKRIEQNLNRKKYDFEERLNSLISFEQGNNNNINHFLQSELKAKRVDIENMQQEIRDLQNQNRQIEERNKLMKRDNLKKEEYSQNNKLCWKKREDNLQNERVCLEQKVHEVIKNNQVLKKENNWLEDSIKQLQHDLEKVRKEKESINDKKKEAEELIENLNKEIEERRIYYVNQIEDQQNEMNIRKIDSDAIEKERDDIDSEKCDAVEQIKKITKEHEYLKKSVSQSKEESITLRKEKEDIATELSDARIKMKKQQDEAKEHYKKLAEEKNKEIERWRKAISNQHGQTWTSLNGDSTKEVEDLKEKVSQLGEELSSNQKTLEHNITEFRKRDTKIKRLETTITKVTQGENSTGPCCRCSRLVDTNKKIKAMLDLKEREILLLKSTIPEDEDDEDEHGEIMDI